MRDAAGWPVGRAVAALPLLATTGAAAAPVPPPPPPAKLLLACDGVATNPLGDIGRGHGKHTAKPKTRSGDDSDDDDATDKAKPAATPHATRGGGTPVEFVFELTGDTGRVRYPAAIVPIMHSGGDRAGWWPIRDLDVSDDEVSGRVALNFANHARFVIDRRTGTLALNGLQANVTGRCTKVDPGQRLF